MRDLPDKIQWHPAFYAAAELELREDLQELFVSREHILGKEPVCIDLLVIKAGEREKVLKNEIGRIMRGHNVLEYKGPGSELSIDTLFKVMGYACLYKGYGETVNEIPADELTVSVIREAYPRELFKELERLGCQIERKYPGIYYVSGMWLPIQIVVIKELSKENHSSFRILSENVDIEDVREFLKKAEKMTGTRARRNIDSLLQVSVNANYEVYEQIRRESIMCEALRELMKDEIERDKKESREQGLAEGRAEGRAEGEPREAPRKNGQVILKHA